MRDVLRTVEASEEEMKEYYDANKVQYEKGATVSAKHILVAEEEK